MTANGSALSQLRHFINARASSDLTDADLLRRFVTASDPAAFEAIVRRHGGLVLGVCRRQLRHDCDIEDCFQATFIVLLRKARSIRQGDSLAGWLYGVAVRVCQHTRSRRVPLIGDPPEIVARDPLDFEARELGQQLDEEVQRLPDRYRMPVLLCHLEGHTQEQAARLLGVPVGTVATRVSRGLQQLRQRLARRGLELPTIIPFAVPESLVIQTTQATSEGAARLATEVLRGWALARLGRVALIVLLLGVGSAGLGYLFRSRPIDPEPPNSKREEPRPMPAWGEPIRFPAHRANGPVQAIAFSADGLTLAVVADASLDKGVVDFADSSLAVRLFDSKTGRPRGVLLREDGAWSSVTGLAFLDGKLLTSESGLYSWDIRDRKCKLLVNRDEQLLGLLAFDGGTAAVQAGDGVRLYDGKNGRLLVSLPVESAWSVVFPADGKRVTTLDGEGVATWDRASGKLLRRDPLPVGVNAPVQLSPDGRLLGFVHALDRKARLWDVVGGGIVTLPGGELLSAAFSPDGRLLALGGVDGRVRLWDVSASQAVPTPPGNTDRSIYRLTFSPDGRTLAAGDLGGGIVLWSSR
jgi:RNA polymerase sigma factor (sigma-70 family)